MSNVSFDGVLVIPRKLIVPIDSDMIQKQDISLLSIVQSQANRVGHPFWGSYVLAIFVRSINTDVIEHSITILDLLVFGCTQFCHALS